MNGVQLSLWGKMPNCPCIGLLDDGDEHCQKNVYEVTSYDTISCDDRRYPLHIASVRGLGFHDVVAHPIPDIVIPSYMPMITKGSHRLFEEVEGIPMVGITLDQLVSPKKLQLPENIRKTFGVPDETKIVLLNYAHDAVIEQIWPKRMEFFKKIADLEFDLVTGIDYSIWHNQPHLERLFNIKRNLITFEEFQLLGIPCIPHVYWYGIRDLERWAEWINNNSHVTTIAVNLQTVRNPSLWDQVTKEIGYFKNLLHRDIRLLITGPSTETKITQLLTASPFSLTNAVPAHRAWSRRAVDENGKYSITNELSVSQIFMQNIQYQQQLLTGI